MGFVDLFAQLESGREAIDLTQPGAIPEDPDEIVYRLGFSTVALAGMPEECQVGRVKISRVSGPVLSQRTILRQRHGLPVVFDKSMTLGVRVGEGELLTVCQMTDEPPQTLGEAISEWREEARAALGILAALLDDRVAIEERFEDVITLRGGQPVASADTRSLLRTFLPFDVGEEERGSIAGLSLLKPAELEPLSEAARWYLKATRAGPSADAIVYLWIAIEALTPYRTTAPKMVEAMLVGAGFDPEWLGELGVGRLAGVRADIVHKGVRDHPLIGAAHYRLETIVRVLIRNSAGISSSWPPALSPAVFGAEAEKIRESGANRETVWHPDGLPAPETPQPAGLEWERVQAQLDPASPPMAVTYLGELQPGWQARLDHWLAQAAEFLSVEFDPIEVSLDPRAKGVPASVEMAAGAGGLVLNPGLLQLPDPLRELRLAQILQEGLAQVAVMRFGLASHGFGTLLIAAVGSWARYTAFYGQGGPLEGDDVQAFELTPGDLNAIGMAFGAAVAGSRAASERLRAIEEEQDDEAREMLGALRAAWTGIENFAQLLALAERFAQEIDENAAQGDRPGGID